MLIVFYYFNINWCTFQANSEDPDETPLYAASDRGLQCLPMFHL